MKGFLVNDLLTCIPGTRTFWHNLLEWIPELEDKTSGCYSTLPEHIESLEKPDYIIRNASWFRALNTDCFTISYLQDILTGEQRKRQIDVCNSSDITVFNSNYTRDLYKEITSKKIVIPIGVDFDYFHPIDTTKVYDIIFVGAANDNPKGFNVLMDLVSSTDYRFCLVMKDSFKIDHPRITVFNKVKHKELVQIYNSCTMLVCTSVVETQHLAGLEAAACDLPIVASNVGVYHDRQNGGWGRAAGGAFKENIDYVMNNLSEFFPRKYFIKDYSMESCKNKWNALIKEIGE